MNVKCPNCATAYVVPDERIGGKPQKMRCSRCKEIFTVKRRSQKTPLGYQEFTGQQNALPKEFAFLRMSQPPKPPVNAASPSLPDEPQAAASPQGPPPPPKEAPSKAPSSGYEDFSPKADFDELETLPGSVPSPGIGAAPSSESVDGISSPAPPPSSSAAPAPSRPVSAPRPAVTSADLFSGNSWETEAPLDLGNYAVPSEKSQRAGKIAAICTGVVLLFFFFVTFRNGFNLSLFDLPEQIAFAFSGEEYEDLPDAVDDLEITVSEKRILSRRGGKDFLLIVTGTVFNNAPVKRSEVVLRGRLLDATGAVKAEARIPCDKMFEDGALKKTRLGQIPTLYRKGAALSNCTIRGESSTLFQLVIENIPADYDQSYSVEIKPVFAK